MKYIDDICKDLEQYLGTLFYEAFSDEDLRKMLDNPQVVLKNQVSEFVETKVVQRIDMNDIAEIIRKKMIERDST